MCVCLYVCEMTLKSCPSLLAFKNLHSGTSEGGGAVAEMCRIRHIQMESKEMRGKEKGSRTKCKSRMNGNVTSTRTSKVCNIKCATSSRSLCLSLSPPPLSLTHTLASRLADRVCVAPYVPFWAQAVFAPSATTDNTL